MDRIVIEFFSGSREGQTEVYPTSRFNALYMGRDPGCDIRLDSIRDVMVSRSHAVIEWIDAPGQPRRYTLTDLLSSNGTFLNGQRVEGTVTLRDRDKVRLGANGPEFQFLVESPQAGSRPSVTQPMPAVVGPPAGAPGGGSQSAPAPTVKRRLPPGSED